MTVLSPYKTVGNASSTDWYTIGRPNFLSIWKFLTTYLVGMFIINSLFTFLHNLLQSIIENKLTLAFTIKNCFVDIIKIY